MPSDRERLDWLIRQGPPGAAEGMGLNQEAWDVAFGMYGDNDRECMRAAIDAAMAPPPQHSIAPGDDVAKARGEKV